MPWYLLCLKQRCHPLLQKPSTQLDSALSPAGGCAAAALNEGRLLIHTCRQKSDHLLLYKCMPFPLGWNLPEGFPSLPRSPFFLLPAFSTRTRLLHTTLLNLCWMKEQKWVTIGHKDVYDIKRQMEILNTSCTIFQPAQCVWREHQAHYTYATFLFLTPNWQKQDLKQRTGLLAWNEFEASMARCTQCCLTCSHLWLGQYSALYSGLKTEPKDRDDNNEQSWSYFKYCNLL